MSRRTRAIHLTPGTVAELETRYRYNPATGCWEWDGTVSPTGYGAISISGVAFSAHRASYTHHFGPIPDGLVIDHLCRNRQCVNPAHLEAVTDQENILRGMSPGAKALRRDECLRGHKYADYARFWQGRRTCAACAAIRLKEFRARRATTKAA